MRQPVMQDHCDLCGSNGRPYARGRGCIILRCAQCALLWTNPLAYLTEGDSAGDEYWGEEVYLDQADAQKRRFRRQLDLFLREASVSDPASLRVLDVGCGLGLFLDVCEERGIAAEGCDLSKRAIAHATRERPRARVGTLDATYPDGSFDAVFAFNLIEHLPHPGRFFEQACRVLRPGGVLGLETPVQESLFHRAARLGYLLSGGRLGFLGVRPGGHIYKFSKATFRRLCGRLGLEMLYRANVSSPFGEIWGKTGLVSLEHRLVYRIALPVVWSLAELTGQGNRVFVLLRKPPQSMEGREEP